MGVTVTYSQTEEWHEHEGYVPVCDIVPARVRRGSGKLLPINMVGEACGAESPPRRRPSKLGKLIKKNKKTLGLDAHAPGGGLSLVQLEARGAASGGQRPSKRPKFVETETIAGACEPSRLLELVHSLSEQSEQSRPLVELWPEMWTLCEKLGWRRTPTGRPSSPWVYFPPGVTRKTGRMRVDYFDSRNGVVRHLSTRAVETEEDGRAQEEVVVSVLCTTCGITMQVPDEAPEFRCPDCNTINHAPPEEEPAGGVAVAAAAAPGVEAAGAACAGAHHAQGQSTNTTIEVGLPDAEPLANAAAASQETPSSSTRAGATTPISRPAVQRVEPKFVGVSWDRGLQTWYASIRHKGKINSLGQFKAAEDAARAFDAASRRLRGEAAHGARTRVNFPTVDERRREHSAARIPAPRAERTAHTLSAASPVEGVAGVEPPANAVVASEETPSSSRQVTQNLLDIKRLSGLSGLCIMLSLAQKDLPKTVTFVCRGIRYQRDVCFDVSSHNPATRCYRSGWGEFVAAEALQVGDTLRFTVLNQKRLEVRIEVGRHILILYSRIGDISINSTLLVKDKDDGQWYECSVSRVTTMGVTVTYAQTEEWHEHEGYVPVCDIVPARVRRGSGKLLPINIVHTLSAASPVDGVAATEPSTKAAVTVEEQTSSSIQCVTKSLLQSKALTALFGLCQMLGLKRVDLPKTVTFVCHDIRYQRNVCVTMPCNAGSTYYSSGWADFVAAEALQLGDTLRFTVLSHETLEVSIEVGRHILSLKSLIGDIRVDDVLLVKDKDDGQWYECSVSRVNTMGVTVTHAQTEEWHEHEGYVPVCDIVPARVRR
jgi:hypothetical protein